MRLGGAIVVMLLMLTSIVRAATLGLSGRAGVQTTSNVDLDTDDTAGLAFNLGATMNLTDERHDLRYGLLYQTDLSFYVTKNRSDYVNQRGRGNLSYDLSPQTSIALADTVSYADGIGKSFGSAPDELEFGDSRTLRNVFSANLLHSFSRGLSGRLNFGNSIFDSEDDRRNNSVTWSGGGDLTWSLSRRQRIRAGFSFTRQIFDSYEELEQVPGWDNIGPEARTELAQLISTESHVFSIFITARRATGQADSFGGYRGAPRDDDKEDLKGNALVRTVRSVVWRYNDGEEWKLVPLVRWEVLDHTPFEVQDYPDGNR